MDLTEELKRKIAWSVAGFFLVVGLLAFVLNMNYNKQQIQQVITVERVTGKYQLVSHENSKGFYITVKDMDTNKVYEDSFVSSDCLLANQKAIPGTELTLVRFTNMNINDTTTTYFFKGAYEQLCTNLNFNPQSGNNYFKMN